MRSFLFGPIHPDESLPLSGQSPGRDGADYFQGTAAGVRSGDHVRDRDGGRGSWNRNGPCLVVVRANRQHPAQQSTIDTGTWLEMATDPNPTPLPVILYTPDSRLQHPGRLLRETNCCQVFAAPECRRATSAVSGVDLTRHIAMEPTSTPHDCFFRETFGRAAIAGDFLRHTLPDELQAVIDLDTLSIAKDTHVSEELRQFYADLVYKVTYRGNVENR